MCTLFSKSVAHYFFLKMASTVQENTCTKVETAADLDGKLKTLLQLMVSRIPADKKISATVVLQLLRTKYADTYS